MVDQSSIRIEKGTVQETLIIPLYARKKCTDKFPLLYDDPLTSKICSMLDYDFSELDKLYENGFKEAIVSCYDACSNRSVELGS